MNLWALALRFLYFPLFRLRSVNYASWPVGTIGDPAPSSVWLAEGSILLKARFLEGISHRAAAAF